MRLKELVSVKIGSTIVSSLKQMLSHPSSTASNTETRTQLKQLYISILQQVLGQHFIFSSLGPLFINSLLKQAKINILSPGYSISDDAIDKDLIIVLEGSLNVYLGNVGNSVAEYPARACLSNITPFHLLVKRCIYEAQGQTIICLISKQNVEAALKQDPIAFSLLRDVSDRRLTMYQQLLKFEDESKKEKLFKSSTTSKSSSGDKLRRELLDNLVRVELRRNQLLANGYVDGSWLYFVSKGTLEIICANDGKILAFVDITGPLHELNEWISLHNGRLVIRCVSSGALVFKLQPSKISSLSNPLELKKSCVVHLQDFFVRESFQLTLPQPLTTIPADTNGKTNALKELLQIDSIFKSYDIALDYLCYTCAMVEGKKNSVIYELGNGGNSSYMILNGTISLYKLGKSDQSMELITPGMIFGEECIFDMKRISSCVITSKDARLLEIQDEILKELLTCFPYAHEDLKLSFNKKLSLFEAEEGDPGTERIGSDLIMSKLKLIKLMKYLPEDSLQKIAIATTFRTLKQSLLVYNEQSVDMKRMVYVIRGRLRLEDGNKVVHRYVKQDQFCGRSDNEDSVLLLKCYADVESDLLIFDNDAIDVLQAEHPDTLKQLSLFCRLGTNDMIQAILSEALEIKIDSTTRQLARYCMIEEYQEGATILESEAPTVIKLMFIIEGTVKAVGNPTEAITIITPRKWIGRTEKGKTRTKKFVANHPCRVLTINEKGYDKMVKLNKNLASALEILVSKFIQEPKLDLNLRKKRTCVTINDLPQNLFLLTVQYLCLNEKLKCRLVCSQWNFMLKQRLGIGKLDLSRNFYTADKFIFLIQAANTRLRDLDLSLTPTNNSQIRFAIKHSPFITNINLSFAKDVDASIVLSCLPYLTSIKLTFLIVTDQITQNIKCHGLKYLETRKLDCKDPAKHAASLFEKIAHLQEIVIHHSSSISDPFIFSMASQCRDLEKLTLRRSRTLSEFSFRSIANGLPNLKHLDMSTSPSLTDAFIYELSLGPQKWENLNFSNCFNLTDTAIFFFNQGIVNLEVLELAYCSNLSNDTITYLSDTALKLKHLNIYSCRLISHSYVKETMDIKGIKVLMSPEKPISKSSKPKAVNVALHDRYIVHSRFFPAKLPGTVALVAAAE